MSPSEQPTRLALIGAGAWGKNYVRTLATMGRFYAVCELNPELREAIKRDHPDTLCFADLQELLALPEVNGICVATPAATHKKIAEECLKAGKDVLVEKPLSLSSDDGRRLVEYAQQQGRLLMVGHLLHYHPAIQTLKKLVADGELGELRYIAAHRLNFGKIRTEENVLWSFAPHDISLLLSFFGGSPTSINISGAAFVQDAIPDITTASFEFDAGRKAHIFTSWLHPYKEQKFVLIGDKKMAVFDDQAEEKLTLYDNTVLWEGGSPIAQKNGQRTVELEPGEPLRNQIQHFIDCIENHTQPITDGAEGLRVLEVLESCQKQLTTS